MQRELAFINLSRRGYDIGRAPDNPRPKGTELPPDNEPIHEFGQMIKHAGSKTLLMVNHEYTVSEADDLILNDKVDLVGFGRPFIYNPVSLIRP